LKRVESGKLTLDKPMLNIQKEDQADIQSSENGYSHIDSTLWDKNGKVAVSSRQTVSVFG